MADSQEVKSGEPSSPEELQARTREVYNLIPQRRRHFTGAQLLESLKNPEIAHEAFERTREATEQRMANETKPVVLKRFDELLAQSPTTGSYKKATHKLVDHVYVLGRKADDSAHQSPDDEFLVNSLQLGSSVGIYVPEGAKIGEDVLYKEMKHRFISHSTIAVDEEVSENYVEPWGELGEVKSFLEGWKQEYTELYGEPPREIQV